MSRGFETFDAMRQKGPEIRPGSDEIQCDRNFDRLRSTTPDSLEDSVWYKTASAHLNATQRAAGCLALKLVQLEPDLD
jgi:hypothetical protein